MNKTEIADVKRRLKIAKETESYRSKQCFKSVQALNKAKKDYLTYYYALDAAKAEREKWENKLKKLPAAQL